MLLKIHVVFFIFSVFVIRITETAYISV